MAKQFDRVSNPADSLQTKRMEGLKAMHATAMDPEVNPLDVMDPEAMHAKALHARAMDPEVNPLDGSLLPLSPPLAYIQKKILPRIVRNPLARSCQRICPEFVFFFQ